MNDVAKAFVWFFVVIIVSLLFLYCDSLLEARREAKERKLRRKKYQEFMEFFRVYNSPAYITKDFEERFLEAYKEWKSDQNN